MSNKATDMLLYRHDRLTPRERVIALMLIFVLMFAVAAAAYDTWWNHPGQPPTQVNNQHSIFDYPVAPPGFTVSAHDAPANGLQDSITDALVHGGMTPTEATHKATLLRTYLGPVGYYLHCSQRFYYLVPYQACALLLQPRTTKSLADWFDGEEGQNATLAVGLIASTLGTVCTAITKNPYFGSVCFLLGLWAGHHVVEQAKLARSRQQCLRMDYNYTPSVNAIVSIAAHQPAIPTNVYAYGSWETWVIKSFFHNGQWDNYWSFDYPTACKMPRDCTDVPTPIGAGCVI